jgi:hypothetical protein
MKVNRTPERQRGGKIANRTLPRKKRILFGMSDSMVSAATVFGIAND